MSYQRVHVSVGVSTMVGHPQQPSFATNNIGSISISSNTLLSIIADRYIRQSAVLRSSIDCIRRLAAAA
jgi:hypothetical protein